MFSKQIFQYYDVKKSYTFLNVEWKLKEINYIKYIIICVGILTYNNY